MKVTRRFRKIILISSFLHSIWLIIFTFIILNSSINHWDDEEIAWLYHHLKKEVIGLDKKPPQQGFYFFDVSESNQLIDVYEDGFLIGNHDITDRKKLAELFELFNKYPVHKYMLCDIQFYEKSPDDSILKVAIEKTPRLLVSSHIDSTGGLKKPLFNVDYSCSDYENDGNFFKYRFIHNDSIKTTPLRLYELIHKKEATSHGSYIEIDGNYMFNNFILDHRIRPYHYDHHKESKQLDDKLEQTYKIGQTHLNQFLEEMGILIQVAGPDEFIKLMKDKIIVLGDFSDRDLHDTISGEIAGPAILMNAYLSLLYGDAKITWRFLLYLFICYFGISYIIFHPADIFEVGIKKLFPRSEILQSILSFLTYFFLILLISFVGYLIFDFQISVIWIIVYVKFADWLVHMLIYKKILDPEKVAFKKFLTGEEIT